MLKKNSRHSKSMSCCALQKQVARQYPSLARSKQSEATFVPFHSERRLGRLISSQDTETSVKPKNNQRLLEKITFKNFEKIYRMVMQFQNRKYSQQTRSSGQRDLINHEWKINILSLPEHKSNYLSHSARPSKTKQQDIQPKGPKFQKMNQYLFKKLMNVQQPKNNPELQALYSNYIQVCEMNENIKRAELLGKAKTKMLL